MNPFHDLAIIIPIAPGEEAWEALLQDLKTLPPKTQIVLVGPRKPEAKLKSLYKDPHFQKCLRWIHSRQGRAVQLNTGAQSTNTRFFWFLHADSRLTSSTLPALEKALEKKPKALHYFILKFLSDGPSLMFINEIGCYVRSRFMGVPFGDQGFCISRENFLKIGGFPEEAAYGEDHLFVWRARQNGIALHGVNAVLKTSARRYVETGWATLTLRYAHRWVRQAYPEWIQSLRLGRIT